MPRPGPRPYECVRRAWHSDRHQPMRGSLIQEIFRVVNETHSSATRKNREWQEKIPVVVLKAEEILYSKANSEEEYMDFKTLCDRLSDAINTIIRRDESTETGELLQPCIEAALNLGCIPRRASRSQRHSDTRCYLSPGTQEPTSAPSRISDSTINGVSPPLQPLHSCNRTTTPQFISYYSTFTRPTTMNSTRLGSESCSLVTHDNNFTTPHLFSSESFPPSGTNQSFPMETCPSLNFGCVYPLFYGTSLQNRKPQLSPPIPQESNCNTVVGGIPCVQSSVEPAEMGILENLFSCDQAVDASNRTTQADFKDASEKPCETECDLSLRLGLLSAAGVSAENGWVHEVEDVDSSSSREGSKFSDLSPRMEKEFCFFPKDNVDDPLESCSSKWSSEGEGLNVEATIRKRKAPISYFAEDGHSCLRPEFQFNQLLARIKKPGL